MPARPGYIVNNSPDVGANLDMAEPDALDFNLLGNQRYGVLSGCAVTVTGSSFTVNVAAGTWLVNGQVSAGGGQVTLPTSSTNARFDLIVGDVVGAISAIIGTPSPNPVFPFYDATVCVFAAVLILPGSTPPLQAQVTDKRVMVPERFATAILNGGMLLSNRDPTAGQALKNLFAIDPNGKHTWLNDTMLERTAAGKIKITDTLDVVNLLATVLTIAGNITSGGDLISQNFRQGAANPTVAGNEAMGDLYKNLTTGTIWIWQGTWVQMSTTVIPTGMTMTGMMPSPPAGWLLVNGQVITQAASGGLWNMFPSWRTGADAFTLPNATDCFYGWGPPGVKGGNSSFMLTLLTANMPAHRHLQSPTTDAGGAHTHPTTVTPGGAHGHTTVQPSGAHVHDVYDPGHVHPPPTPNTSYLMKVPTGTGASGYQLGNQDITLPPNTGANVDGANHGTTGIQITTAGSNHDHVISSAVDHSHTVTVNSGGAVHSHPITENTVGGGAPFDIRPPFMGMYLFIKT